MKTTKRNFKISALVLSVMFVIAMALTTVLDTNTSCEPDSDGDTVKITNQLAYMDLEMDAKCGEGKCDEGKCGEGDDKEGDDEGTEEDTEEDKDEKKCGEGKCDEG